MHGQTHIKTSAILDALRYQSLNIPTHADDRQ